MGSFEWGERTVQDASVPGRAKIARQQFQNLALNRARWGNRGDFWLKGVAMNL